MIDLAALFFKTLGEKVLKKLLDKAFQGNKDQLQQAYEQAFEKTVIVST